MSWYRRLTDKEHTHTMDTRISRCITHFGTVYGFLLRNLVTHDKEKRQVDAINLNVPTDICSKVVVCGRAVRWWDDEIKQKIEHRREAYKKKS